MTILAMTLVVGALVDPALAAPVTLPTGTIDVGNTHYTFYFNTFAPYGLPPGFAVGDVTEDDGPTSDSYDGAWHLNLNGASFADADGTVDISPDESIGIGGQTLTAIGKAAGLSVTAKIGMFRDATVETARVLYRIRNKKATTKKVTALFSIDYGSEAATVIEDTTDGDVALDSTDSWFITSNDGAVDDNVTTKPVIITALGDGVNHVYTRAPALGVDELQAKFTFKVKPGKTVQLLFFHHFEQDVSEAVSQSSNFDTGTGLRSLGLLDGIGGRFLNWAGTL